MGIIRSLVCASLLVGCAQAHGTDDVAPGIYELTIERGLDACSPARPAGVMGTVAVIVDEGTLDAPVPDADASLLASPRVRLAPERAFHAETNRRVTGCEGAWVHEEWTLLEGGAEGFVLSHRQLWEGLSSCAEGSITMRGAPVADCESERRLAYRLAERCAAPCALRLVAPEAVGCVCE
ncbi:MAG TPA: hypothetical protein VIL20_01170 [Sandaracinaceae bacterium]